MALVFAPPPLAHPESWQDDLERQVRALPGVHFVEVTAHGSKIYKAGAVRLVVPRGGGRAVREGAFRDFEAAKRRVLRSGAHEFGTHPNDVALMRPLGPSEDVRLDAGVAAVYESTTNHHGESPTAEAPPGNGGAASAPVEESAGELASTTTPPEDDTAMAKRTKPRGSGIKKGSKLVFVPCPVAGCDGRAVGKHLEMHKRKGELAKDWRVPKQGKARAAFLAKVSRNRTNGEGAPAKGKGAVGHVVKTYLAQIAEARAEVARAVHVALEKLTALDGTIARLGEFADTLHTENTMVTRELSQLKMNMQRAAAAFGVATGATPATLASKLHRA
jgi:hypothetical protein